MVPCRVGALCGRHRPGAARRVRVRHLTRSRRLISTAPAARDSPQPPPGEQLGCCGCEALSSAPAAAASSGVPIRWNIACACRRRSLASARQPVAVAQRPRPASASPSSRALPMTRASSRAWFGRALPALGLHEGQVVDLQDDGPYVQVYSQINPLTGESGSQVGSDDRRPDRRGEGQHRDPVRPHADRPEAQRRYP